MRPISYAETKKEATYVNERTLGNLNCISTYEIISCVKNINKLSYYIYSEY